MQHLPRGGHLLDLGTGTGCIPVAILANRPDATGLATDLNPEALAMARDNAERNGVAARLDFARGDWFAALTPTPTLPFKAGEGADPAARSSPPPPSGGGRVGVSVAKFDLITSNPPYIGSAVLETLAPEVKDFDPRLALDGGPDGLAPYRVIAAGAGRHLRPGGRILVEVGYDQGDAVGELFAVHGWVDIVVHKDLNGLDRVVEAHHLGDK